MERVLLTGGAGFIGRRLVDLLHTSYDVVVLDSLSPQIHGESPEQSPGVRDVRAKATFIRGSVTDADAVHRALAGVDRIIHLAAETGTGQSMYELRRYADVNVVGLATVLECAQTADAEVAQIVLPSSRSVYGEGAYRCGVHGTVHPDPRSVADMQIGDFEVKCPSCGAATTLLPTGEDSVLHPASFYAYTKLSQEDMIRQFCGASGIPFTIFRYQNVYGVGQSLSNPYTGLLSIFATQFAAGEPVNVYEDGAESRDFVHVDDVARLTAASLGRRSAFGRTLNLGSGEGHSVLEVAQELKRIMRSESSIRVSGDFRKGDIKANVADMAIATEVLGMHPEVPFERGLRDFAEWVLETAGERISADGVSMARSLSELRSAGMLFEKS